MRLDVQKITSLWIVFSHLLHQILFYIRWKWAQVLSLFWVHATDLLSNVVEEWAHQQLHQISLPFQWHHTVFTNITNQCQVLRLKQYALEQLFLRVGKQFFIKLSPVILCQMLLPSLWWSPYSYLFPSMIIMPCYILYIALVGQV